MTDGTKRTLMPQHQDPGKYIAAFSFQARDDGSGAMSIFACADQKPRVLNDQVRIVVRVYFRGGPNLFLED